MSIKINNISKRYDNGLLVLKNIDLEINNHEFVCILGPSGCGKSTLLNIIAGLDVVSSGTVVVDNNFISGPANDRVMVFQAFSLFPWLTVFENIKFGLKLKGLSKIEQENIALKYLKLVNLEKFKNYNVLQLSGGMQQRAAIARALAVESPYILMDEPFSSLDKQTINILLSELELLWSNLKNTIIYVTHSVEEAVFLADKIVILSKNPGQIKKALEIDLPRPRKNSNYEIISLKKMILAELQYEVMQDEEKINF